MDIIYKKMEHQDVEGVYKVELESFSMPWSKDAFYNELFIEEAITIVAKNGDEICGFVNGRIFFGEFFINNIAVLPQMRGNKIGENLLTQIHKLILLNKGISSSLEVRESNIVAQNLYKKFGYEILGMRKNFYEKPIENALIMTKIFLNSEERNDIK